jgi:hypothetical protein
MASSGAGRIFVLAFFLIALSLSSTKVAIATRKLLTPISLPDVPDLTFFPPGTPIYPENRLPPPITSFIGDIPSIFTTPIFTAPAMATAP